MKVFLILLFFCSLAFSQQTGSISKLRVTDTLKVEDGLILPAGSIDSTDLADNAVNSLKILGGAVTEPKIGTGAVTTYKIDSLTIRNHNIDDDEIRLEKMDFNINLNGIRKLDIGSNNGNDAGLTLTEYTGTDDYKGFLLHHSGSGNRLVLQPWKILNGTTSRYDSVLTIEYSESGNALIWMDSVAIEDLSVNSLTGTDIVDSTNIADNSITSLKILAGGVTFPKLDLDYRLASASAVLNINVGNNQSAGLFLSEYATENRGFQFYFNGNGNRLVLKPHSTHAAWDDRDSVLTVNYVEGSDPTVWINDLKVDTLRASTAFAGTATFTGTTVRDEVYIAGSTASDLYFISAKESTRNINDWMSYEAKTDSLIVYRAASGTDALVWSWLRVDN